MEEKKIKEFAKKYNLEESLARELLRKKTVEERASIIKEELKDKILVLKNWSAPKSNPSWSHDHCEVCKKEISNLSHAEKQGYNDETQVYWICVSCYEKYFK